MRSSFFKKPGNEGFGLIETLIGAAIISIILFSLSQIAQFALKTVDGANLKLRSAYLAEEGVEAVRVIRDTGWTEKISSLNLNKDYYPKFSSGTWTLDAIPQPLIDGTFDRRVVFSSVHRGAGDDIVPSGGVLDPNAKKVKVSVSWSNRGRMASTIISTYITNLFSN